MKKTINIIFALLIGSFVYAQQNNLVHYPQLDSPNCTSTPIIINENHPTVENVLVPYIVQTDSDGDGIPDNQEGDEDWDGDGIPNYLDTDSDGDGVLDGVDECYATFGFPPSGCSINQTYRKVWWVHGYQGDETSLIMPANDVGGVDVNSSPVTPTGRFQVRSYRPNYTPSQLTLQDAADNLKADIIDVAENQVNTENNFIIGHSMGGLVARTMGTIENPNGLPLYDGLITFGTPHQGAFAANTLVDNPQALVDLLDNACESLSAGPANEGVSDSFKGVGAFLVVAGAINYAVSTTCSFIDSSFFATTSGLAKVGVEPELTTNAISTLGPMPTRHNAVFWGEEDGLEDGTILPRFYGSFINSPNDFPLYGADASDQMGIDSFAVYMDKYDQKAEEWSNLALIAINSGNPAGYVAAKRIADGYTKGVEWYDEINDTWLELIGARTTVLTQIGCDYYDYDGSVGACTVYLGFDPNCGGVPNPFACEYPVYVQDVILKPNDGFILAESAMNAPGMNYPPQFMEGSNHFQMKNDSQMEDAVRKIFEDSFGEGPDGYFYTEFR